MIPWGPETIFIHLVNPGGSATFIYLSDTDISHMHIPLATYTSRRYINLSQEWQSEPIGLCSQILTDSRGTTWDHSEILISLSRSYRSVDTSEPGNYKRKYKTIPNTPHNEILPCSKHQQEYLSCHTQQKLQK